MSQRYPQPSRYAPSRGPPPSNSSRYDASDRYIGRQRSRSPPPIRDRRDSRDFPDRNPRYPPHPPAPGAYHPAPGYARGRGRPSDFDHRGRNRYPDERDREPPFRRSPSRGPRDRRDDYEDYRFRRQDSFSRRDEALPRAPPRQPSPIISRRPSMMDNRDLPSPRSRDPPVEKLKEETPVVAVPQFGIIPPILAAVSPVTPAKQIPNAPTGPKADPGIPADEGEIKSVKQESPSQTKPQQPPEQHVSPIVPQTINTTALIPVGPRSASLPSTVLSSRDPSPTMPPSAPRSHKGLPDNIPTAPRSMRVVPPPVAPRGHRITQATPTSIQWRPNQQSMPSTPKTSAVPSKRDSNGDEKDEKSNDHMKSQSLIQDTPSLGKTSTGVPEDKDINMIDAQQLKPASDSYLSGDEDDTGDLEEVFEHQTKEYQAKKLALTNSIKKLNNRHKLTPAIQEIDREMSILGILDEIAIPPSPSPSPVPNQTSPLHLSASILHTLPSKEPSPTAEDILEEIQSQVSETEVQVQIQSGREETPEMAKSPDLEFLPYIQIINQLATPISNPDLMDKFDDRDNLEDLINARLEELKDDDEILESKLKEEYASNYKPWKKHVLRLDQQFHKPEPIILQPMEIEIPSPPMSQSNQPMLTPTESRRSHKYSSELDLERAIQQSLKDEEERKQKAEKEKTEIIPDYEKEAVVPALLSKREIEIRSFKDTSLLRTSQDALRVFEFEPPVDKFTTEQSREFNKLIKRVAKKWHIISDALRIPTKDCIYHYYFNKYDNPNKRSKNKKSRKAANKRGTLLKGRLESGMEAEGSQEITTPGLTETGRPRRAAAPTFSKPIAVNSGKDSEADESVTGKKPSAKPEDKKALKPPPSSSRKTRTRPLVAKTGPNASPQKTPKERKDNKSISLIPGPIPDTSVGLAGSNPVTNSNMEVEEWIGRTNPVQPQEIMMQTLIPPQAPQYVMNQQHSSPYCMEQNPAVLDPNTPSSTLSRPRAHSNTQKGANSYWSVMEELEFAACLAYYGTDYNQIALHINKKTPVMIKNHYLKYRSDETKFDILQAAEIADEKRKRGEPLGELPSALKSSKAYASYTQEPMASVITTTAPYVPFANAISADQAVVQPAPVPKLEPRMGYFQDSSPLRGVQSIHPNQNQIQNQSKSSKPSLIASKSSHKIKTENENRSLQPLTRERSNTRDALTAIQRHQDIPVNLTTYPSGMSLTSNSGPNIRLVQQSYNVQDQFGSREQPQISRQVIDLTAPPKYEQLPARRQRSPSMRDYSSGPHSSHGGSHGPHYVQPHQTPTPPNPHTHAHKPPMSIEPKKASIMSMLNPEPSEEKSKKDTEYHASQPEPLRDTYPRDSFHQPTYVAERPTADHQESWRSIQRHTYTPNYPPHNESPRLGPQPNSLQDYRTNVRSARSPPPHSYHHSRNPSYSTHHGPGPGPVHGHPPTSQHPASASSDPFSRQPHRSSATSQSYTPSPVSLHAPSGYPTSDRRDMDSKGPMRHFRNSNPNDFDPRDGPPPLPQQQQQQQSAMTPQQQQYSMQHGRSSHHSSPQPGVDAQYAAPPPSAPPPPQQQQQQQPPPKRFSGGLMEEQWWGKKWKG